MKLPSPPTPSAAPRPAGIVRAAIPAAIVALALALRLWRIRTGLPDFLDEAIPFKQALAMWGWDTGRTDLNPHFFHYPTLTLYLHFWIQKLGYVIGLILGRWHSPADWRLLYDVDPTGPVVAARLLGVIADAATVWAVWRIGERLRRGAGAPAALLAALAPGLIATSRAIYADTIMVALLAWTIERLLAWRDEGRREQLRAAVILGGLAAGAKYTAGSVVLPLAWVLYEREGLRGLRRWPLCAGAMLGVFLLTSPYVALDFREFWRDFSYERLHMAQGHLGALDHTGAGFSLRELLVNLGPAGVALLLGSLLLLRSRRPGPAAGARERAAESAGGTRASGATGAPRGTGIRGGAGIASARGAIITLWLALVPHLVSLATFRMEATRYLLPVLPLAAALAAATALALIDRMAPATAARGGSKRLPAPALSAALRRQRVAAALVLGVLVLPVAAPGLHTAASGSDTTQQQARRWIEAHVPRDDLIVQEAYGATLLDPFEAEKVLRGNVYRAASPAVRARFDAVPIRRAVLLPMVVSGRLRGLLGGAGDPRREITLFSHASGLNQAFYDPALFVGADWFVTSGAVQSRYEADPARYPEQIQFYRLLAANAEAAARFAPHGTVGGPEITIWRITDATRRAFTAHGELDLFWWARSVPDQYRREVERLAPPAERSVAYQRPDGQPTAWVISLREIHGQYVLPFTSQMAHHLVELKRYALARGLAASALAIQPKDIACTLLFSISASNLGDVVAARGVVDNTLANLARGGHDNPSLHVERARLDALSGDTETARLELESVLAATAGSADPARRMASDLMADLQAGRIPPTPFRQTPPGRQPADPGAAPR